VPKASCEYQNLYVWPNGRIEGVVLDSEGRPAAGVPVQAFIQDWSGKSGSSPVREVKTDASGAYTLGGIPPGKVLVGVNGEKYEDRMAWAPTFYPGVHDRNRASRLLMGRAQTLTGIDLQLPPPRQAATLMIEARLEDGSPVTDAVFSVEDPAGTQRAFVRMVSASVYAGETYVVKGSRFQDRKSWEGRTSAFVMTGPEMHVRVTLHEVKRD